MASKETEVMLDSVFLWRIENLSYFDPELHGRSIDSPSFLSLNLNKIFFQLNLYPKGENEADSNLALRLFSSVIHDFWLDGEWSLLNANGSPLVTSFLRNMVIKKYDSLALPDCPTQEEVFQTRKSSFLPNDTLTILFRVLDTNMDFPHAEHISAVSRIHVLEESFTLRFQEFSALHLGEEVTANLQLKDDRREENLLLKFSLTGASLEDSSAKVEIVSKNIRHRYRLKLLISDKEQKVKKCVEASHEALLDVKDHIWVLPEFLSRQEILEDSSMWLCGDDLILLCKVTATLTKISNRIEKSYLGPANLKMSFPKYNPGVEESESKEIIGTKPNAMKQSSTFAEPNSPTSPQCSNYPDNDPQRRLGDNCLSALQKHNLSDFVLHSGDVSFPVHKVVLSARSHVFKAMFSGKMKEADSDFLVVPDVDPNTLRWMILFLYEGTIDCIQYESAVKLYYAADKYQVQSLKRECSSILKSNVSVRNVSDVLELADRYQDQELTSFVHYFILNHFEEVMMSNEWIQFMDRNLLAGKTVMKIHEMQLQMKRQRDPLD